MAPEIITAIWGMEPGREGEYPTAYIVGQRATHLDAQGKPQQFTVAQIKPREQNYGDHGLLWYDAYGDDGWVYASMQARAVAEIHIVKGAQTHG